MSDKLTCNAPNPGTEMRCQREAGHTQECSSKFKILYPNGIVGGGVESWVGPNNLPKKEASNGEASREADKAISGGSQENAAG